MSIRRVGVHPLLSSIVLHNNTVYLAGQIGDGDTFDAQCRSALHKVDDLLAQAGSEKAQLLQATIYLSDNRDFPALNRIWTDWLGSSAPPARATIQATLAKPEFKVEFVVIAAMK